MYYIYGYIINLLINSVKYNISNKLQELIKQFNSFKTKYYKKYNNNNNHNNHNKMNFIIIINICYLLSN